MIIFFIIFLVLTILKDYYQNSTIKIISFHLLAEIQVHFALTDRSEPRIEVPRSPGNHACQLRACQRRCNFRTIKQQTRIHYTLLLAVHPCIPYANSMLQIRARRVRRSNQYCIRKIVQPNNSRPYARRSYQGAKKYITKLTLHNL